MSSERSIEDVVETIKKAKESGRGCALLLGAGCSMSAGIPIASGFVEAISKEYPRAYKRAETKTYAACMAELAPAERRDLIARYIDKAKPNWAHIGVAQLVARGFADRVLTVNFDPLLVRACSLVGAFPAAYDLAASQLFAPAEVPAPAVFYLHGQRSGFVLMNTKAECEKHAATLSPIFEDAGRGRVWIVAGYSGENDPVFDHLASVKRFDHNLYWIGYERADPPLHVRSRLLSEEKYAFHVGGYDADSFFIKLAQSLNCFPPPIVSDPFGHLDSILSGVCPFPVSGSEKEVDPVKDARRALKKARDLFQTKRSHHIASEMEKAYIEGKIDDVIKIGRKQKRIKGVEKRLFLGALQQKARAKAIAVKRSRKKIPDIQFADMKSMIDEIIKHAPNDADLLSDAGITLAILSYALTGETRSSILERAEQLLARAARLEPGNHLYNLACVQSLMGLQVPTKENLRRAFAAGDVPGLTQIEADSDLEAIRDKKWFKELLKKQKLKKPKIDLTPVRAKQRRAKRAQ